jgi:hypothetical protein
LLKDLLLKYLRLIKLAKIFGIFLLASISSSYERLDNISDITANLSGCRLSEEMYFDI